MTLKGRLDKLVHNLTPKQYILLMVDEMEQSGSFDAFTAQHIIGKSDRLKTYFEGAEEGIRAKMKGQDKTKIDHAVRKAHQELGFYYALLCRTISSFQTELYRHAYNGLLLNSLWDRVQKISLTLIATGETGRNVIKESNEAMLEILDMFKTRAGRHLYHLFAEQRVNETISQRYYDGKPLLFPQDRTSLDSMTEQALNLIERVQDVVHEVSFLHSALEDGVAPLVDVDDIRAQVEANLDAHVTYELDMAKAEIYSNAGNSVKVNSIYESYNSKYMTGTMPRR